MKLGVISRWNVVRAVFSSVNYLLLFLFFIVLYLGINVWANRFYEVIGVFLSFRLSFVIAYALITLLIGAGIALTWTIIAYKLKQMVSVRKDAGMTAVGIFGGLLGGACPGCFVGLFPTLAGVFGITATLSSLPFFGFEIQVLTLIIVLITLYIISNPLTCKVKTRRG